MYRPTSRNRTVVITRRGTTAAPPPSIVSTKTTRTTAVPKEQVFADMQRDMEAELEQRRLDWEREISDMQKDFFNMNTESTTSNGGGVTVSGSQGPTQVPLLTSERPVTRVKPPYDVSHAKTSFTDLPDGSQMFRLCFDVRGFDPEDFTITTEEHTLKVSAKRVEESPGSGANTHQFNRQVAIPNNVDPDSLTSYLSPEGVLTLEAPVNGPQTLQTVYKEKSSADSSVLHPPTYDSVVRTTSPVGLASRSPYLYTGSPNIVETDVGRKLQMTVDIGRNYEPEDVQVTLLTRKIVVKARREEKIGTRTSKREFSREFDMPERLENSTVRAKLDSDGQLYIGGSVRDNADHERVTQLVRLDMPIRAKACKTTII